MLRFQLYKSTLYFCGAGKNINKLFTEFDFEIQGLLTSLIFYVSMIANHSLKKIQL